MRYDADFIATVYHAQRELGDAAAQRVFEKLFGVNVPGSPYQAEIDRLFGKRLDINEIKTTSHAVGKPGECDNAVPWIKEFRNRTGCYLKTAKDVHDFVKVNPGIHD